jgi:hypothetical protein
MARWEKVKLAACHCVRMSGGAWLGRLGRLGRLGQGWLLSSGWIFFAGSQRTREERRGDAKKPSPDQQIGSDN